VTPEQPPIRVLVVDDTVVGRELLVAVLQSTPGLQVVGTARNGREAVRLASRLKPDIIAMDVHMPEMDGYEATRQIMAENPRPIVMVTASLAKDEHQLTFNALQAGALTIVEKPTLDEVSEKREQLIAQIKMMAEVKVVRRWARNGMAREERAAVAPRPFTLPAATPPREKPLARSPLPRIVAVAASTGGPGALATILGSLPAAFGAPILLVQHVTKGFGEGFAQWLAQQTPLRVRVGRHGDKPQAGEVVVAPDDYHMVINELGSITLTQAPSRFGIRPAADYLFHSVADRYGAAAVGVILTGMGSDGAEGLRAMRLAGARTIAQDQYSCVVFGMPAVAIEFGAAEQILPADRIGQALTSLLSGGAV
jgi:two-component system, chemotaxis family, protein-glutamate methylesterase/glutaminase